jgi:hypothetical protein
MNHLSKRFPLPLVRPIVLILIAALGGCETPPKNDGSSGGRIDPTSDASSEKNSLDLRSADLVNATDRMAADIASRLDINNRNSPPRIFVGKIENKTNAPQQNYQVFLQRLRAQLNASGARSGLQFIRERQFVEDTRHEEYGNSDPNATAQAYASKADYVLTCEIFDLPNAGTNYFLLDYQLVQLRDAASGPDVGSGAIVWENSYEVKFK